MSVKAPDHIWPLISQAMQRIFKTNRSAPDLQSYQASTVSRQFLKPVFLVDPPVNLIRAVCRPRAVFLNFQLILSFPCRTPFAMPGHYLPENSVRIFSGVLAKLTVLTGLSKESGNSVHLSALSDFRLWDVLAYDRLLQRNGLSNPYLYFSSQFPWKWEHSGFLKASSPMGSPSTKG